MGCLGPQPPRCSPVRGRLFGLAPEPHADKQEPRRKREVAECWGENVGVWGASGDASLSPQAGEGDRVMVQGGEVPGDVQNQFWGL